MLRSTLLALAAVGTLVAGLAGSPADAEARHRHDHHRHGGVGLYFGFPFVFDDYGYRDRYYYSGHRNYHCHWVKVKRKHHKSRLVKRCHSRHHHDW